jgi:putative hemolysin
VPDALSAMQVLEAFRKHRQTAALVVDEHGNLQGLVTLNDVTEALGGNVSEVMCGANRV